jgi:hypothetical protein
VLGAFVAGVPESAGGLDGLQAVMNPRAKHNNNASVDILFICGLILTEMYETTSISGNLNSFPKAKRN